MTRQISIHAPTWGATNDYNPNHVAPPISIHAPTWGATSEQKERSIGRLLFQSTHPRGVRLNCRVWTRDTDRFQSTHPRGVRPVPPDGAHAGERISIHAPTWGATSAPLRKSVLSSNFNPRTHVGCDKGASAQGETAFQFQSTHPRGVRPMRIPGRIRSDISIHAPTWGATQAQKADILTLEISIHAPTWGATLCANIIHTR